MTLAYFDCFSGISGDMILGALVDAGLPVETLRAELACLELAGYTIDREPVTRGGIAATRVRVVLTRQEQPARRLSDVTGIIGRSALPEPVRRTSIGIFERLARAEARVHGITPEAVHFHEVGAVDAIVDIVGSVIGLRHLGVTEVAASPVVLGSGTVETAHGSLPVPAPATVELLTGIPTRGSAVPFELTTPTGAAILSSLCTSFGPLPLMKIRASAHGAGGREIAGQANVLRLLLGDREARYEEDASVMIETNIDDMNPQLYDHLIGKLMAGGAQDAYLTPIIMKKGRPAVLLSTLTDRLNADRLIDVIFRESTSIGVRIREVDRRKLTREIRSVETPYGVVRIKVSTGGGDVLTVTPEYEDCRELADKVRVPLKEIIEAAKSAYQAREERTSDGPFKNP